MNNREIGSEYHYHTLDGTHKNEALDPCPDFYDRVYTFSGRTAIETVLRNLPKAKTALLPSYCCDSMIQPFRDLGIKVSFYDVSWNNGFNVKLGDTSGVDLILWCNYFGFKQSMPILRSFTQNGGIIIEDITHSYLSDSPHDSQSHYVIASIRKWFPLISGGYCASRVSSLSVKPELNVSKSFIDLKKGAMKQKTMFLNKPDDELKDNYLRDFSSSNHWLAENYSDTLIDEDSTQILSHIDKASVIRKRKENAEVIYKHLVACKGIVPMFDQTDMDCPLFVPIVLRSPDERDKLRSLLTSQKIYCPIHWPKPNENCSSNLYDLELSLVCDQRYEKSDMERMMQIIKDFDIQQYCF